MNETSWFVRSVLRCASIAALGLLAGGTSGCSGMACTLVGCDSGLSVFVAPKPSQPYSVELLATGTNVRRVVRCDDPAQCFQPAYFQDYVTSRATIEVVVGTDTTRRDFTSIRYDKFEPNGEECGPTCLNAEVTVPLVQ